MEVGDDRNYLMTRGIDYMIARCLGLGLVGVDVVVVEEDSPAEEALGRMDCNSSFVEYLVAQIDAWCGLCIQTR